MNDKDKHIKHWIRQAEENWAGADLLFRGGHHSLALFICHLVIEKYCKALWVRDNVGDVPPKIHNLLKILTTIKVQVSEEHKILLLRANQFQIEGRYEEDQDLLEKKITPELAIEAIENFKILQKWISKELE